VSDAISVWILENLEGLGNASASSLRVEVKIVQGQTTALETNASRPFALA
jgi:hypothetical protein